MFLGSRLDWWLFDICLIDCSFSAGRWLIGPNVKWSREKNHIICSKHSGRPAALPGGQWRSDGQSSRWANRRLMLSFRRPVAMPTQVMISDLTRHHVSWEDDVTRSDWNQNQMFSSHQVILVWTRMIKSDWKLHVGGAAACLEGLLVPRRPPVQSGLSEPSGGGWH